MIKGEKLKRIIEIGCIPTDSPEENLRKRIMTIMVIPYSLVGIIWGLYFLRNGNVISGLIPLFYGLFSLSSFFYFVYTKRDKIFRFSQVLFILVLPFFLQLTLGGFSQSSGIIIWSCTAPFIALLFYDSYFAKKWFFALVFLLVLACFLDESVREHFPKEIDANDKVVLFGANFICVASLIFSILLYFLNELKKIKIELIRTEILLEASTEIEKQKELLIARKDRLDLVMGSLEEVVWGRSLPDYQLKYVSNSAVNLYGFAIADWYENPNLWTDMVHPDEIKQVQKDGESLFTKGISESEFRIITSDKKIKWINSKTRILKSADGTPFFMTGIAREITKLKEVELKLIGSENIYRALFEKSANPALILQNNLFIQCNDAAMTMLGYKNKTALFNVPPFELSPEKQSDGQLSSEKSKEMNNIAYETGSNRFEWDHVKSNGEVFPVEVLLTSLPSDNSNDKTLHVVWRDITEEKKGQKEVSELSKFPSENPNPILRFNEKFELVYRNAASSTNFLSDFKIKENKLTDRVLNGYFKKVKENRNSETVIQVRNKRHYSLTLVYVKEFNYTNIYASDISNLINQVNEKEKSLEEKSEKLLISNVKLETNIFEMDKLRAASEAVAKELRQFIETANAPIFGIDADGKVNEWNQTAEKITRFKKEEVLGKDLVETYITEDYRDAVKLVLGNALKGKETANFEFPLFTKNNQKLMVLLNASTRRNTDGEIIGVLGVGQDISELDSYKNNLENLVKNRTLELENSLEREKELGKLKTSFVSMASHEFRTPLTTINALADIILLYKEKLSKDEIEERLSKIKKEVQDMAIILDDILIIGKSDSQKLEIKAIEIDLVDLVKTIVTEYQLTQAEERDVIYKFSMDKIMLNADPKWIKHIVNNLFSNAIKYSDSPASVGIDIRQEKNKVILSVSDQGIGISKKDQKILFEPFHRGENVGNISGTGLGLTVLEKAVLLHKGEIEVISEIGEGTEISIHIPT